MTLGIMKGLRVFLELMGLVDRCVERTLIKHCKINEELKKGL